MKICSKCKQEKPIESFSRNKGKPDGRSGTCKECHKEYRASYYERNKDKELQQTRSYKSNNKKLVANRNRKYYLDHIPEHRARVSKWRKENPNRSKAIDHRRRARAINAPGHFTVEQWQARSAYHGHKCYYCGSEGKMSIEHRIPLVRGGSNWPANLVPSCKSCNSRKGTKTELEFAQ